MASNRLARTNDDIQFVISRLLREIKDPRIAGRMISVTHVETTGDLRYSKIWLSVMGLENESEKEFKKGLKSASGWLRKELGDRMSLRYTPELVFEIDHSIAYGAHINQILEGLNLHAEEKSGTQAAEQHEEPDEDEADEAPEGASDEEVSGEAAVEKQNTAQSVPGSEPHAL